MTKSERNNLSIIIVEIIIGLFFHEYFLSIFLAGIRTKFVLSLLAW